MNRLRRNFTNRSKASDATNTDADYISWLERKVSTLQRTTRKTRKAAARQNERPVKAAGVWPEHYSKAGPPITPPTPPASPTPQPTRKHGQTEESFKRELGAWRRNRGGQ